MTSCLVAINKNRDMCFDMKNGKKTYFSGEIPVNDCQNVWRGLKSIRLIFKICLRISKVSCKESSRSQSLSVVKWALSLIQDLYPNYDLVLAFCVYRDNFFFKMVGQFTKKCFYFMIFDCY